MKLTTSHQFHGYLDANVRPFLNERIRPGGRSTKIRKHTTIQERTLSYQFYAHFHPYVEELTHKLITQSVSGLQAADTVYQRRNNGTIKTFANDHPNPALRGKPVPELYETFFSEYSPSALVQQPRPVKDLDFSSSGAYSGYNWELFFHVPLTLAIHLSRNQRYEEAQHWFHYIFDPTDDSDGSTPERFWRVKPFQYNDVRLIEDILVNLASGADPKLQQETVNSINAIKDAPFRPHVVARYRQSAYMFKTVMAYLDNLIDWGDSLFRQDTGESINEATLLYVLAANILGPKPQAVPKKGSISPQTYASLRADLDALGNALREVETNIPFDLLPHPTDVSDIDEAVILKSLGNALYFCIPRNDKLVGYWDTVADRLFKIRNSLNIQGIFRQLPLFEPPIDPALLARATASGLDIGAVVSGINQPLPLVRFRVLIQRAMEIAQEVKQLGNSLLSAIEKEDNEAIALLRVQHESILLGLVETVRYAQWKEAIKNREGLEKSLIGTVQRYVYYERQLGKKESDISIPELDELDLAALESMDFQQEEPEIEFRPIDIDIAEELLASAAAFPAGGKLLSSHEVSESGHLDTVLLASAIAGGLNALSSLAAVVPQFAVCAQPMGGGAQVYFGGQNVASGIRAGAQVSQTIADYNNVEARRASRMDTFARREQEWAFQINILAGEITQIFKQLRAAQIREVIAEKEWRNHQQQMQNAQEIEQFLKGEETRIGNTKHTKVSIQSLYTWMKREIQGLHSQCFRFAFEVAKKAERAIQHELGKPELTFLQFNYLAGKEGLLAGEKLYLDIKRMEMAYHDQNQREYELTKHVSLLQVNPHALLQLRSTGSCMVALPEELFDIDGPGHYFRRIKHVSLTIPCVVGPYSSINCTLTLTKSSIRKSTLLGFGYARVDANDNRFSDYFGSLQSIVTSTGQNDSGLFEPNLNDERYLPFENSGVISEWKLQLPGNPSNDDPLQFNYSSISDVIMHIRYTAREGGQPLKTAAISHLKNQIDTAQTVGSVRLFSLRHEFSSEWAKFKAANISGENPKAKLTINLRAEHYPFWSQNRLEAIQQVTILAKTALNSLEISDGLDNSSPTDPFVEDPALGGLRKVRLSNLPLPNPVGQWSLHFSNNSLEELYVMVAWGKSQ